MERYNYTDIDFIIFKTHYTHRIIDNYDDYFSRIENFSNNIGKKFLLYGVYVCPHSYGYSDHPFIYPAYNIPVMEEIKRQVNRIEGSILVKNCYREELSDSIMTGMISEINDFCGFFNMDNIIEQNVQGIMINRDRVNVLFMSFNTESG